MGKRRSFAWIAAMGMLVLIFIRPQHAVDGAQRGMRMWYQGVAPALLPFLALMPMLTGSEACKAYEKMLSPLMRKLFRLPGAAAPAIVAGIISGSPGGAAAVCSVKTSGGIDNKQAARIALAVSGVSPAWLVLGVGSKMLGSKAVGLKLAAVQLAIQLFLLKLLEKVEIQTHVAKQDIFCPAHTGAVRNAVETTIAVCGYMAVFGACGNVIASFAGKNAGIALMALLDLPSGAALIAENRFPGYLIALSAAAGFGGICIAAQNMDKLRYIGVRWRDYIAVRALAAAMFAIIGVLVFRNDIQISRYTPKYANIYALSLLAAALFALPTMIYISKNIFLNKGKVRREP